MATITPIGTFPRPTTGGRTLADRIFDPIAEAATWIVFRATKTPNAPAAHPHLTRLRHGDH